MKKLLIILTALVLIGCSATEKQYLVSVNVEEGGYVYKEVITQAYLDDYGLPVNRTTELNLKKGRHSITWTWTNVNGFGMHMNPTTQTEYFNVDDDMTVHIWGQYVYFE